MERLPPPTSVRLPPDLLEKIDALAARELRSRSNMLIVLLREAVAAREKPSP